MNKRAAILQRAMRRMEEVRRQAEKAQKEHNIIEMMAQKMEENGTYFVIDEKDGLLIIADLKHTQTIH